MAKQGTDGSLIVLFFSAFSCVALLPNLLFNYHPMTPWQWLCMFLLGIGAMVGQYGITFAYKYAPPAKISIFDYFNVIITTLLGIFVLNQYPTKIRSSAPPLCSVPFADVSVQSERICKK